MRKILKTYNIFIDIIFIYALYTHSALGKVNAKLYLKFMVQSTTYATVMSV